MILLLQQTPFEKMDLGQFGYVGLLVGAACFAWVMWLKYGNGRAAASNRLYEKVDEVHDDCATIKADVGNIKERVARIETKVFS